MQQPALPRNCFGQARILAVLLFGLCVLVQVLPQTHARAAQPTISAGFGAHVLALHSSGQVLAWGDNLAFQLGDLTPVSSLVPLSPSGLAGMKTVAAGAHHSLAVNRDGMVFAWGRNDCGQLGNGTTNDAFMPVRPLFLDGFLNLGATSTGSLCPGAIQLLLLDE